VTRSQQEINAGSPSTTNSGHQTWPLCFAAAGNGRSPPDPSPRCIECATSSADQAHRTQAMATPTRPAAASSEQLPRPLTIAVRRNPIAPPGAASAIQMLPRQSHDARRGNDQAIVRERQSEVGNGRYREHANALPHSPSNMAPIG
jgi:hypothetical protein